MKLSTSYFQLLRIILHHRKLYDKRNLTFEENRTAKILVWIFQSFLLCYFIFISVLLALAAQESKTITAYELMFGFLPFILSIDFLIRLIRQQTPSQLIKPYILLPISKYICIDCFIFASLGSYTNLIWFTIFLPYAIISVLFSEGLGITFCFLLGLYIVVLICNQWYAIVRALTRKHLLWWFLPIAVYVLVYAPLFLGRHVSIERLLHFYASFGTFICRGHWLAWLILSALLAFTIYVNRKIQLRLVLSEVQRQETAKAARVFRLSLFDRYGEIGEYMKLEIKSIMRNKAVRTSFLVANAVIVMFSAIISLSGIYDNTFMLNFWCLYNFVIYGATMLTRIMCYEGNYIDCLMVHRENILSLLKAKYYLFSLLLVIPLLFMLPTVFVGKCSLLMLFTFMFLAAGPVYFCLFQMAVYNKRTIPLNTKYTGKGMMENNYIQIVVQLVIFTVPLLFLNLLQLVVSETIAYIVLILFSIAFMLSSNIWIHRIYRRMMNRRYSLIEGFHTSR